MQTCSWTPTNECPRLAKTNLLEAAPVLPQGKCSPHLLPTTGASPLSSDSEKSRKSKCWPKCKHRPRLRLQFQPRWTLQTSWWKMPAERVANKRILKKAETIQNRRQHRHHHHHHSIDIYIYYLRDMRNLYMCKSWSILNCCLSKYFCQAFAQICLACFRISLISNELLLYITAIEMIQPISALVQLSRSCEGKDVELSTIYTIHERSHINLSEGDILPGPTAGSRHQRLLNWIWPYILLIAVGLCRRRHLHVRLSWHSWAATSTNRYKSNQISL